MVSKSGKMLYIIEDGEELQIFNTTNVNHSSIQQNGVDLEIINLTALGDMVFDTTLEMRFSIATNPQLELTVNLLRPTNTAVFDLGDATHIYQIIHQEQAEYYHTGTGATQATIGCGGTTNLVIDLNAGGSIILQTSGGNNWILSSTANMSGEHIIPTTTSITNLGDATHVWQNLEVEVINIRDATTPANLASIIMNGVDLEITNTTALGDIIINATVEIREEISSVVRTILTATEFTEQDNSVSCIHNIDTYSTNAAVSSILALRKSDSNTLGNLAQTDDGEQLGGLEVHGVDNGTVFGIAASMIVTQVGASAAQLASDMVFATYSNAGINTNQFALRFDGSVEIARGAPVKFFDSAEDDLSYIEQMETLPTSDAVQTTMHTITLDDNHTYTIEVRVASQEDDASDRRGFIKSGVFYRDGGGAVQQGVTISQMNEGSAAVLLDFTVAGNTVLVSMTGIALEDWRHGGHILVVEMD